MNYRHNPSDDDLIDDFLTEYDDWDTLDLREERSALGIKINEIGMQLSDYRRQGRSKAEVWYRKANQARKITQLRLHAVKSLLRERHEQDFKKRAQNKQVWADILESGNAPKDATPEEALLVMNYHILQTLQYNGMIDLQGRWLETLHATEAWLKSRWG